MRQSTAVELVNDLSSELRTLAVELDNRASRYVGNLTNESAASAEASYLHSARRLLEQRRQRANFFPSELFHEPAWDMLLALCIADEDRTTMNVKTLVATTAAPVTTSQRWIDHLHKLRLIERITDPLDRRRVEISLSDTGQRAVAAYLERIQSW